jgi:hypothetical protein
VSAGHRFILLRKLIALFNERHNRSRELTVVTDLKQALFPMSQGRAASTLIFQFGSFERVAIEMSSHLFLQLQATAHKVFSALRM